MTDTIDPVAAEPSTIAPLTAPAPLFPDILDGHAKWRARKPALVVDGETMSWSDLVIAINRCANGLLALGLQPGDAVAVAAQNCRDTVIALLGIARAGCVSAPLNLTITDDAMAGMITDADARAVMATADQTGRLAGCTRDRHRIVLDGGQSGGWTAFSAWLDGQDATAPPAPSAGDAFNIIYSSGTTGQPKGILHTHQTRLDWAYDVALALRYHSGAQTLCTLGLYSNISWVMMLCTLLVGGTLHVARRFDAAETLAMISDRNITHTAMVPVQFQRLMDHPDMTPADVSSMHAMMSCGSSLSPELKAWIFERFDCGVIELYGLTEGVITTLDPEDAGDKLASVGKPLPGTDLMLIDDVGRPVATGEAGEIVSYGRIVMPGYLNRPEATREAIWLDENGRRWLRTGDVGKLDEDGFLYIVDRKKDMIISGGQNIFPADIERVIIEHDDVSAAAVIGLPDPAWGETPVAILELKPGADCPAETILAWTNERVGKRQRLSAAHVIDELPRNPNGKILKRELRRTYSAG